MLRVAILFLVLVFNGSATGQSITISQSIDKFDISYADSVLFEITLNWKGSQTNYLFYRPINPTFDKLRIKGYSSSISSSLANGIETTTKKFSYVLIPVSSGLANIEPIKVSYLTMPDSVTGELMTEPMSITIAKPTPVTTQTSSTTWWYYLVAVLIIGGWGIYFWKKNKANNSPVEEVKTSKEEFLDNLDLLRQSSGTDLKKFQSGLHTILVEYFKAQYHIDISNCENSNEVVESLKNSNFSESSMEQLGEWIVKAKSDKFRPVNSTPGETVRLANEIKQFFESNNF